MTFKKNTLDGSLICVRSLISDIVTDGDEQKKNPIVVISERKKSLGKQRMRSKAVSLRQMVKIEKKYAVENSTNLFKNIYVYSFEMNKNKATSWQNGR